MADHDLLVKRIKAMQAQTLSLHSELMQKFSSLSLDEKIEVYVQAYFEENNNEMFDSFLKADPYYSKCEDVSLYDDLYWERYETMTLSEVFDWVLDNFEDSDEDEILIKFEYFKDGQSPAHKVFRDLLMRNIGSAVRDW